MSANEPDQIVDQLCDLSPEERAAWFAEHPLDAEERKRIEHVLAHFDTMILDPDAMPARRWVREAADSVGRDDSPDLPEALGPYAPLEVLGTGGMGIVYRAEQAEPRRQVAIKVLRRQLVPEEHQRRFEREAELLGRLQHPGIAQVFEFGRTEAGATYLVMELIDGERLTRWAEARQLERDARLELLAELADAVHHAHLRGVVHRDLKPGNVLVTNEGRVKVIDFGVARALDQDLHATRETSAGQIVGTLAYMSPEQVRGDAGDIDARADVYALGALAYELLARRLPHEVDSMTIAEAARHVVEIEPPRLGKLAAECRGDVERIVGKALEKEPDRRYASAAALSADIRRFLAHEPIVARPASAAYQLRKLARRHRALVAVAGAALLAVLVGAGVAFDQARVNKQLALRESDARVEAEALAIEARQSAEAAESARAAEVLRASELDQVVSYQEGLIVGFDARKMATGLRGDLLTDLRTQLERHGHDDATRNELVSSFEQSLDRIDLVGVATSAIDRSLLSPAVQEIENRFADQPLVQAQLFLSLSMAQARIGLDTAALNAVRRAAELRSAELGDEHELTLMTRVRLAGFLAANGRHEEALEAYLELEQPLVAGLAPANEASVQALLGLAANLSIAGHAERSLAAYGRAIEASESVHGPTAGMTLIVKGSMARALASTERYAESEALFLEVLDVRRPELAQDFPPAVGILGDLGTVIAKLGRAEEGAQMIEEACERYRRRLGDRHPRTVGMVERLGLMHATEERFAEAEPLLREALAARRESGSSLEAGLGAALSDLSSVLLSLDQLDEAEELAEEAWELTREQLGESDPVSVHALERLKSVYEALEARDSP